MSQIVQSLFDEAKNLAVGEAIFIRCMDKKEQTSLASEFEAEKASYAALEPVHASQIIIKQVLKELKQYVVIERVYRAPFVAFHRDKEGLYSKLTIDPERKRILQLMLKDGFGREEIEDTLGGLTEEEIRVYFQDK